MKKLCAISFNSKDFPDLRVAQSSFANVRTTIIRHDQGVTPTFSLFADRSYGVYLWDTILDAGKEFGMQPVGWQAIGGQGLEKRVKVHKGEYDRISHNLVFQELLLCLLVEGSDYVQNASDHIGET